MPRGVAKNRLLPPLPTEEPPVIVDQSFENKTVENPLAEIIQSLANAVNILTKEVAEIKAQVAQPIVKTVVEPLQDEGGPQIKEEVAGVPTNLLKAARAVLGPKFSFKCEASPDLPQFIFTVIVPAEYSPLQGKQIDERSRVIANPLGANGVEEWCKIVKNNVIKFLGTNIPSTL